MPRWVKALVILAIVLIVGLVVTRLLGVQHGPGLHTPSDGGHTPPAPRGP